MWRFSLRGGGPAAGVRVNGVRLAAGLVGADLGLCQVLLQGAEIVEHLATVDTGEGFESVVDAAEMSLEVVLPGEDVPALRTLTDLSPCVYHTLVSPHLAATVERHETVGTA